MLYGLNDKMQGISLPPLSSSIQVSVAAREPPQRSWSRFKKVLIDNPKDSDLLHRQKLWNFQKLNRGAFRSQLASLPDIPYRVHTNNVENVSVAVQADVTKDYTVGARLLFPRLASRRDKIFSLDSDDSDDDDDIVLRADQHHKACSPINVHLIHSLDYSDDFEDDSAIDDLGLDFDSVVRKQNAGTMTETGRKATKSPKKEKRKRTTKGRSSARSTETQSILRTNELMVFQQFPVERKMVKFYTNDVIDFSNVTDKSGTTLVRKEKPLTPDAPGRLSDRPAIPPILKLDLTENDSKTSRPSTTSSNDNDDLILNIPIDKMGHSSHLSLDNLSILDILSGSKTDRSRAVNKWQPLTERLDGNRRQLGGETEANRIWFEQIVGDKEVIDTGTYHSFARTRPSVEQNYSDFNDKYTDLGKSSSRKNANGRLSDEVSSSKQTASKNGQGKLLSATSSILSNKSRSTRRK